MMIEVIKMLGKVVVASNFFKAVNITLSLNIFLLT